MKLPSELALLATLTVSCAAQIPIPRPVWTPPDASEGFAPNGTAGIPNPLYQTLLGNSLWFYDAQRAGVLTDAEKERVPWRNDSVLNDGADVGRNLSGGFFDAGNFIKAAYPLSFTLSTMAWSAINFGQAFEQSGQAPYLDSTIRAGLDWLRNAYPTDPEPSLYVFVGDNEDSQNSYWGPDIDIPTERRLSYAVNASNPGTDALAAASAAFSSGALLYGNNTSFNPDWTTSVFRDDQYHDTVLSYAISTYYLAQNSTKGLYAETLPDAGAAYKNRRYEDDLIWAALWLHKATAGNETSSPYLTEALEMYNEGNVRRDQVFTWASQAAAIPLLLSQILPNQPQWKQEWNRYIDNVVGASEGEKKDLRLTDDGLLYYRYDSPAATLNPALNVAALIYHAGDGNETRLAFADRQVNYALGNNTMRIPYVVGVHPSSPKNPHSPLASGGVGLASIDTSPESDARVLYGAVVGGPDQDGFYYDERSDYIQSEVALDYNAPMVGIAAYKCLTSAQGPFYATLDPSDPDTERRDPPRVRPDYDPGGLSQRNTIIVAVVGSVVTTALVFGFTYWQRDRIAPRAYDKA